jgi:Rrf2 family protein
MFITRETDYAVRIIRELSRTGKQTAPRICEQEQVPRQYGYKILKKLEKAALVRSIRGASGGYALCRSVSGITLLDVIRAIDEQLVLSECLGHDFRCPMNSGGKCCGVHAELCRVQDLITAVLREKSLAEIFKERSAGTAVAVSAAS